LTAKPRIQRRLIASATEKDLHKMMRANLSEKLREKYDIRSLAVREGDTAKIFRGDFAGIEGKIIETDRHSRRVIVEGVTREKVSGEQTRVPVHVSKVTLTNLDLSDKWRSEKLKAEKPEEAT
jgi:large subunit ribosomal protein L24